MSPFETWLPSPLQAMCSSVSPPLLQKKNSYIQLKSPLFQFQTISSYSITKDTAKEQTEAYAKSIEGIKGLTHKIEYKDDYLTEKLTIDFSKADIEELQSKQLLQTSGNQKADYISYKETAKLLEKAGYKEVKDGKFEDLK